MQHGNTQAIISFLDKEGWSPVADETGFQGRLDIDMTIATNLDIQRINRQLQPHGLAVRLEKRNLDKLVIEQYRRLAWLTGAPAF